MTERLLEELRADYARRESGLMIVRTENRYQMCTSPESFDFIRSAFANADTVSLSQAAMETLAIVAYRQPVSRAEIERIRGVQSSSSLDLLIAKGLVALSGKLDTPGRPSGYSTTGEFLKLTGMGDLSSLPSADRFEQALSDSLEEDTGSAVIQ